MTSQHPVVDALCSHVPSCDLFPKFGIRSALRVWQTFYCEAEFEQCARYRLTAEGRPVPPTLLPNGKELDPRILGASS
jgi:hypothetical protein